MPWQLLDHPTASQGETAILSSDCLFCNNDNSPCGQFMTHSYDVLVIKYIAALRLNEECMCP